MLTKNLVVEVWCELWLRHRLECLYMVVLSALVCVQWTGVSGRFSLVLVYRHSGISESTLVRKRTLMPMREEHTSLR